MPENVCFPPTSVRVIVLITIIFALIAIVFEVVLVRRDYVVPGALGVVATTALLCEEVLRRLCWWQRPDTV
ncbi:MAG: hypothetical protein ACRDRW_10860 [Pseudonocardiaceae bacterium]